MPQQHDTFKLIYITINMVWLKINALAPRRFVYNNLHDDDYKSKVSTCVNYVLISDHCQRCRVLLESVNLYKLYQSYFDFLKISILIFSGEYLLRLWSIVEKNPQESAWKQRFRWMKRAGDY